MASIIDGESLWPMLYGRLCEAVDHAGFISVMDPKTGVITLVKKEQTNNSGE